MIKRCVDTEAIENKIKKPETFLLHPALNAKDYSCNWRRSGERLFLILPFQWHFLMGVFCNRDN